MKLILFILLFSVGSFAGFSTSSPPSGSGGSGGVASTVSQGSPGASPWPVTISNTAALPTPIQFPNSYPVTGAFPTPVPNASVTVSNFPATQAVSGTFWQSVQPVSGTVAVTGAPTPVPGPTAVNVLNFPSTQNVAIVSSTPIAVTGAFPTPNPAPTSVGILGSVSVTGSFPTPQPVASVTFTNTTIAVTGAPTPIPHASVTVDGTVAVTGAPTPINFSLPTPIPHASVTVDGTVAVTGAPTPINFAFPTPIPHASVTVDGTVAVTGAFPTPIPQATVGVSSLPALTVAGAANSSPIGSVSLGNSLGKALVMKTGLLTSTATTADQVSLTYTVTALKTFYLTYASMDVKLTAVSATGALLGECSVETPSGTKVLTTTFNNPTIELTDRYVVTFPEPIPVAAGVVVRWVCTPAGTTSTKWFGNFGGYEK